ncbi:hypothetical protein [Nocardia huaxiensis]|uniref:Uncharacterized protein n=1 Tax=Nocardia huaxiensis TaxID=2755382 RepID=A0A7D6ZCP6_9NOCA|nr:hypothetical protein [Nocardia huaxiensis]QLY32288.1 hypothetical protein H0264_08510 [Nocardia huaxiensis]UFS94007.1 hypothetical protein LPY97_24910 [Nocardia huaxiensis]
MSATITLTDQDKSIVRTAAYGAVSLLAAAGAPHKGISQGTIALTSATGLTGHLLSAKARDIKLPGKNAAELADHVLPALTAAVAVLGTQSSAEAENFVRTVLVAVESATGTAKSPAVTAMAGKIAAALGAA